MENFLTAVNNAKSCFEKNNLGDLMNNDRKQILHLCYNERKNLASILMSDHLLTSNLIRERINVLHERAENMTAQRRVFLDNFISTSKN